MTTTKKSLEEFGISTTSAIALFKKSLADGSARVVLSRDPIPVYLGGMAAQEAGVQLVDAPKGDAERIWYFTRPKATEDMLGEAAPTGGFRRVLCAIARGPHDQLFFEHELGELDDDGLLKQSQ